jgi:hypothetical protein
VVRAGWIDEEGHVYVMADRSGRMSPERWARRASDLQHEQVTDRLIAKANNGASRCGSPENRLVDNIGNIGQALLFRNHCEYEIQ